MKTNHLNKKAAIRIAYFVCVLILLNGCKKGYDAVGYFQEGLASVKIDNMWGFINDKGENAIPYQFDEVREFKDGLSYVRVGSRWGLIDKTGQEIAPCSYSSIEEFKIIGDDTLARVKSAGKTGIINMKGEEIVPCDKYDNIQDFQYGLAVVENAEKKCGIIDVRGTEIVPCIYNSIGEFKEGFAKVENGSDGHKFYVFHQVFNTGRKYGFIDMAGKEVVPCQYLRAESFSKGRAAVAKIGKMYDYKRGHYYNVYWGYIDATGKEVISCHYIQCKDFNEDGLAFVMLDEGWWRYFGDGIEADRYICKRFSLTIDLNGKVIAGDYVKAHYLERDEDFSYKFNDMIEDKLIDFLKEKQMEDDKAKRGVFIISHKGKKGLEDNVGNELIPCIYDDIGEFYNDMIAIKIDDKWGLIDFTGEKILPIKYKQIGNVKEGFISVQDYRTEKWYFLDSKGKRL